MQKGSQRHNDKVAGRLLRKNIYLSLYLFDRVVWGFTVRGSWRPNRNCTLCLSRSPDAQPEAQRPTLLGDLLHLINFSGLQFIRAQGPFGLMWLSLPHLVYNSASNSTATLLSWLSYKIVQRPLSRLLDLWNRMFNLYQVEITVMQFPGHFLPVHQSMSVPWEFFLPRSISSANFRPRNFLSWLPLECVPSFRCITLKWHFWQGRRSKYNSCRKTKIK